MRRGGCQARRHTLEVGRRTPAGARRAMALSIERAVAHASLVLVPPRTPAPLAPSPPP